MQAQSRVPSTNELNAVAGANVEEQRDYTDGLQIGAFDQSSINKLETRVAGIDPSPFKTHLEKVIQIRKKQLKPLDELKFDLEIKKLELEKRKQQFHEEQQVRKQQFTEGHQQRKQQFIETQQGRKQQFSETQQVRKQQFSERLQNIKIKFEFGAKILIIIGLILAAQGIYGLVFSAPQFSVPAGGNVQKGETSQTLQGIGGTTIGGLICTLIGGIVFGYINYRRQI